MLSEEVVSAIRARLGLHRRYFKEVQADIGALLDEVERLQGEILGLELRLESANGSVLENDGVIVRMADEIAELKQLSGRY